jgi:hypothetical protein
MMLTVLRPPNVEIVSLFVGWILIHTYSFAWTKVHPTELATAGGMRAAAFESETISGCGFR